MFTLPESLKIVGGGPGLGAGPIVAANALGTGDFVCMKNVHKAWAVIVHQGANDTDLTVELREATDVAGGTAADVTATLPIWADVDFGTQSDALSRQTDAATYAIDPATESPIILVIEWDPAKHTAGYDCIAVKGNNGHASNNVCVLWFLETRYPADQPPTAITD
jgi:hypothetical protein